MSDSIPHFSISSTKIPLAFLFSSAHSQSQWMLIFITAHSGKCMFGQRSQLWLQPSAVKWDARCSCVRGACMSICPCVFVSFCRDPWGHSNLAQQSHTVIIAVLSRWCSRRMGRKVFTCFLPAKAFLLHAVANDPWGNLRHVEKYYKKMLVNVLYCNE